MSQRKKASPTLSHEELLAQHGPCNYGAVLRYFRKRMDWQVWELALYYSTALRQEGFDDEEVKLVTAQRIYAMENQNKVPRDQKRRWILARLLDIPPMLFGLEAAHPMAVSGREPASAITTLLTWQRVDMQEYRIALARLCTSWHTTTLSDAVTDIKRRIQSLHSDIPFRTSPDKEALSRLLCEYYFLSARIADDQGASEIGIELLSRAIIIAEGEKRYDLYAYALRVRAGFRLDIGHIKALEGQPAAAQEQYDAATRDALESRSLAAKIPPLWRGIVLLSAGATVASTARDHSELLEALKVVDQGAREIGKDAQEKGLSRCLTKKNIIVTEPQPISNRPSEVHIYLHQHAKHSRRQRKRPKSVLNPVVLTQPSL
jgi:hypothetical protein